MSLKPLRTTELSIALRRLAAAEDALEAARQDAIHHLSVVIRKELVRTGESQAAFARRYNLSRGFINDILGHRRFSLTLAQTLASQG